MLELAFFIAVCWAVARGWDNARKAVRTHTAARRKAVPDAHKRRAARQAATGWWVGEISHGFPHIRNGMAAGWHDHRDARGKARVATARRAAEHARRENRWQAEIAAYLHALEVAAAARAAGPSMSDQLRAHVAAMRRRLGGPDDEPEREDDPHMRGENCTDPDCKCHEGDPPLIVTTPPTNGRHRRPAPTGGSPMAGDVNYTEVLERCDKAIEAADHAVAESDVQGSITLVDDLGTMLRDDAETMGKAAELGSAAAAVKAALARWQEAAEAMKARTMQAYQAHQEATDSTGTAPEPEFTTS